MAGPLVRKIHHVVFVLVRLILGAIFIAAGIPKILDTASFAGMVYNYQLLPDVLINFVAITLPWVEVTVGCLLIVGVWLPGAVAIYNLLMISFLSALAFNVWRGLDISCGCFSTKTGDAIDMLTIFRDLVIFGGALYLAFVVFVKKITKDRMLDFAAK